MPREYIASAVPADPTTRSLLAAYTELRRAGMDVETLIAGDGLSDDEAKRLDKAATVMKVSFKMLKKVLRARGVTGCVKPPQETCQRTENHEKPRIAP